MARHLGWIDLKCLQDDAHLEDVCNRYKHMLVTYESIWLIPSKILISSDPIATMNEGNPLTYNDLWEEDDGVSTHAPSSQSSLNASISHTSIRADVDDSSTWETSSTWGTNSESSYGSPTKLMSTKMFSTLLSIQETESVPFRRFLQDCGVSLVIRTNLTSDSGIAIPSYERKHWKSYDIEHMDMQFAEGEIPPRYHFAETLAATIGMLESDQGAILIHCRRGFGRSISLGCCLACYHYNISGKALLGWALLSRPGIAFSPLQEQFLLSLKGRADLRNFIRNHVRYSKQLRTEKLLDVKTKANYVRIAKGGKAVNAAEVRAQASCGCVAQ